MQYFTGYGSVIIYWTGPRVTKKSINYAKILFLASSENFNVTLLWDENNKKRKKREEGGMPSELVPRFPKRII